MVNMVPVDPKWLGGKGWRQGAGFLFAANQHLLPLTAVEFPIAAAAMPIAFIEGSGRYLPVAVTSPVEGRNLFISPTGQWLGNYVPAALRSYPFRLGAAEGSSDITLWIDKDSGWIVDAAEEKAQRFFEEDGSPSDALKAIVQFLQQIEQARALTAVAVAGLAEARLIKPWPLTVTVGNQQVSVTGLHGIDQAALDALDEHTFIKLRKTSSLPLAYAQIISAHSISWFRTLATTQQQIAERTKPLPPASSLFATDDGGTIQFR